MNFFRLDTHTAIHFLGCYGLTFTINMFFECGLLYSAITSVSLGLIWELLDSLNHQRNWRIKFLDPRGADVIDLLFDALGAFLPLALGAILCQL